MPPEQLPTPPTQGTLFIQGPLSKIEYPETLSDTTHNLGLLTVALRQRSIYLQGALIALEEVSSAGGFLKALHTKATEDLRRRYGVNLPNVTKGKERNYRESLTRTRQWFTRAFGMDALLASGMIDPAVASSMLEEDFSNFMTGYGGSVHEQDRKMKRQTLRNSETYWPTRGLAAPVRKRSVDEISPNEQQLELLSTQEKLFALRDDPRAGFLPATNLEKNMGLALLDYIGDAPTSFRTTIQLHEVFGRQKRTYGRKSMGRSAVRSIVYEMGDFLINARQSLGLLRQLHTAVREEMYPHISLATALGPDHRALPTFIRYLDQLTYRETGSIDTKFDIFRTRTIRNGLSDENSKHKTIEDQYTIAEPKSAVNQRIQKKAHMLHIGEVRKAILAAAEDQARRATFWEVRLRETRVYGDAWRFGREALAAAEEVELE